MNWDTFIYFAITSGLCWISGAWCAFRHKRKAALTLSGLGSALFLTFIVGFWIELDRPPLRTMGETRLWYSFFLSVIGVVLYGKLKYKWMLGFGTLMSFVFVFINLFFTYI